MALTDSHTVKPIFFFNYIFIQIFCRKQNNTEREKAIYTHRTKQNKKQHKQGWVSCSCTSQILIYSHKENKRGERYTHS